MFYALLCILTVSVLPPIFHMLGLECVEAQRQGSCPTCCWGSEFNCVVTEWIDGGAVACTRHQIASANLVNNAKNHE